MTPDARRDLVFSLLKSVPSGSVVTYASLARAAGTHPRAVAAWMRGNRDPEGVPCFRVVMSDGRIGGYSAPGGPAMKEELLRKSGVMVERGRIDIVRHLYRF